MLVFVNNVQRLSACPSGCSCHWESDTDLKVDCHGKEIQEIPYDIPLNTTKLYLQHTNIAEIPPGRLLNLSNLVTLDFNGSVISHVHNDAFINLDQLRYLILEKNNLQRIPTGSFGNIGSLRELNIASNKIQSIPINAFSGLNQLAKVTLSNNEISSVDSIFGHPLLTEISLNRNRISQLSGQFTNVFALKNLDLSKNQISTFDPSSLGSGPLQNLTNLDLSGNLIHYISCSAFQNLPNIATLSLADNKLTTVPPTCVLQHLSHIVELDLSRNQIVSVQDNAFSSIQTLQNLRLNDMPSLLTVSKGAFQGLSQIQALSINNNPNFTEFTKDHVKPSNHPRLTQLFLHGNGFRYIEEDVFIPQSVLFKASLQDNPLHCNCSLKWIARVIKNYLHHAWANDWIFYSGSPGCASPPNMAELKFKDLIEDDLTCDKPQIRPVSPIQQVAYRGWNSSIVADTSPGLPWPIWHNPRGESLVPYRVGDDGVSWFVKSSAF